jgi:thiol-disulfide isomerase/thioredoxin
MHVQNSFMKFSFTIFSLLAAFIFFTACGNDQSQSAANEAALPHNMEQEGNLTEAEAGELAAASGKTATLIEPADLLAKIKSDTTSLLVVNFWKTECLKCVELQRALQGLQTTHGERKLRLLSVNLDGEDKNNGVNLVLRKAGIATEVVQVKNSDGKWRHDISGGWSGNVPAFFIKSKDGIKQFHNRELSAQELVAMLEPLLL